MLSDEISIALAQHDHKGSCPDSSRLPLQSGLLQVAPRCPAKDPVARRVPLKQLADQGHIESTGRPPVVHEDESRLVRLKN